MLIQLQNILAWLLVVGIVGGLIVFIRGFISKARRPAETTSPLLQSLPPVDASVNERLARLRLNLGQEFRRSLREHILLYMFLAIVLEIMEPPPLFSGLLRVVFGTLIYFCLIWIMQILIEAGSLYASYRSVRLRVLLDAQPQQEEQVQSV